MHLTEDVQALCTENHKTLQDRLKTPGRKGRVIHKQKPRNGWDASSPALTHGLRRRQPAPQPLWRLSADSEACVEVRPA